jgi:hypothetical protein
MNQVTLTDFDVSIHLLSCSIPRGIPPHIAVSAVKSAVGRLPGARKIRVQYTGFMPFKMPIGIVVWQCDKVAIHDHADQIKSAIIQVCDAVLQPPLAKSSLPTPQSKAKRTAISADLRLKLRAFSQRLFSILTASGFPADSVSPRQGRTTRSVNPRAFRSEDEQS